MSGQLVKRGDRKWLVRVPLGRDSIGGRRAYHNATVDGTKKDAERYLHAALAKRDQGTLLEPARVSLGEYLDKWLDEAAKPRIRSRTYADYRFLIDRYLRPRLGAHRLDRLAPINVQELVNALSEDGLSPKTVRHAHGVLLSALNQAMRWGMLTRNVAALVELPRLRPRELRALSTAEADRFRVAVRGTRFEALFLLLLGTGMRPSEALGLAWTDLDLEAGRATVRRVLPRDQKTGGGAPRFEEPKTARSRRVVPLSPSVVRALVAHRKRQAAEKLEAGPVYADYGLVFASLTGGALDERNVVHRHFKPAVKRAKLDEQPESEAKRPPLRLYDLRHTHVTLSLRAGEPVHLVSARVGHASARMTLDVYAHALPADQADASARLEAVLFGG